MHAKFLFILKIIEYINVLFYMDNGPQFDDVSCKNCKYFFAKGIMAELEKSILIRVSGGVWL